MFLWGLSSKAAGVSLNDQKPQELFPETFSLGNQAFSAPPGRSSYPVRSHWLLEVPMASIICRKMCFYQPLLNPFINTDSN
jgi:hypothetical protein